MKLLMLGLFLALGLELNQAEEFTKCSGVNVGLTKICSQLTKMDCYNAGGGCCATYSDGTGTVSVAEKSSGESCGYCFTGSPDTLIEEAILEAISTTQGKHRHSRNSTLIGKAILEAVSTVQRRGRGGARAHGGDRRPKEQNEPAIGKRSHVEGFTDNPDALIKKAILEAISTAQNRRRGGVHSGDQRPIGGHFCGLIPMAITVIISFLYQ